MTSLANAFNLVLQLNSRPATIERLGSSEIVSGFVTSTSATLNTVIQGGIAYVEGIRVSTNDLPVIFNSSKDIYVEISSSGVISYSEVNNGAAAPAVVGTNLRFLKVVTNATSITSCTFLKQYKNLYGIAPVNIKLASSNYFRNLASVEETIVTGREFVIGKQTLDAVYFPAPKRGDRIKDADLGVSTISEVRELQGLGGEIIGYRIRTS